MAKVVIELTNRCNLSCRHCPSGRHGGRGELPLDVLKHVLDHAQSSGFSSLAFTGGEPTLHRRFEDILQLTSDAGYRFGLVTNGSNFESVYPQLLAHRSTLEGITFSVDGASEATHDATRGPGSFRRVMKAISVCAATRVPYTINMVVTSVSRSEIAAMANLGAALRAGGVRYGHFFAEHETHRRELGLAKHERRAVEAEVVDLAKRSRVPVGMAPGHHTMDLFPCAPLQEREINIDWRGNLTKCCHISGDHTGPTTRDVVGSIMELGFGEALRRLRQENASFRYDKKRRHRDGELTDDDLFPCDYCARYYAKGLFGVSRQSPLAAASLARPSNAALVAASEAPSGKA